MEQESRHPDGDQGGSTEGEGRHDGLPRVDEVFADAVERQLTEQRLLNELLSQLRDGVELVREDVADLHGMVPAEGVGLSQELLRRLETLEERLVAQRPSLEARLDALEAELAAVRSTSRAQLEEIRVALVQIAEQLGTAGNDDR